MASDGESKFRDCGKIIANLLSPKRQTQLLLEQLLRSLASYVFFYSDRHVCYKNKNVVVFGTLCSILSLCRYFHPSNGGAWSGKLAVLLLSLVRTFAKRVAKGTASLVLYCLLYNIIVTSD